MKIKTKNLLVYLGIILATILILNSFGEPKGSPIVYVTLSIIGFISFFFSAHTKLNICIRRNINIFAYVFFFLAPWQQYTMDSILWESNGLRLQYPDELRLKTNFIIIICLLLYNVSSEFFEKRESARKSEAMYEIHLSGQSKKIISVICVISLLLVIVSGKLFGADNVESSSLTDQLWNIVMFFPVCCLYIIAMAYPDRKNLVRKNVFWVVLVTIAIIYFPLFGVMARFLLFGTYISILCLWFSKAKYNSYYFLLMFLGLCFAFSSLRHLSNLTNLSFIVDFIHPDFDAYQIMMTLIKYTENKGIVFGRNVVSALAFLIPRSIWKGKFANSGGIAINYYGSWFTNVSSPLFGEFYFAFGWLGVMAGPILVAYIFSKIDSWNSETHLMKKGTFCIFSGMAIYISRGSLLASMAYTLGLVLSCYVISKVVHVGVKKINLNIP